MLFYLSFSSPVVVVLLLLLLFTQIWILSDCRLSNLEKALLQHTEIIFGIREQENMPSVSYGNLQVVRDVDTLK